MPIRAANQMENEWMPLHSSIERWDAHGMQHPLLRHTFVRRHRHAFVLGIVLSTLTALLSVLVPQPEVRAATATSVPVGRLLAANCAQCHGTNGMSGSISQLAGVPATDMFNKLKDQQTHSSIMGAQARGFTDAELQAIAQYFASLPKP